MENEMSSAKLNEPFASKLQRRSEFQTFFYTVTHKTIGWTVNFDEDVDQPSFDNLIELIEHYSRYRWGGYFGTFSTVSAQLPSALLAVCLQRTTKGVSVVTSELWPRFRPNVESKRRCTVTRVQWPTRCQTSG